MPLPDAITRRLPRPQAHSGLWPKAGPTFVPTGRLATWLGGDKDDGDSERPAPHPAAVLATPMVNILAAVLFGFLAQFTFLGTLEHNRDQNVAYDDLRLALAEGTAPVGPVEGKPLARGMPLARMKIPAIGLKEVVLEGTTSGVLRSGVGHRRDSVLPGQVGTSILMGRRMAFGGPFSEIGKLAKDDEITLITGQGEAKFRVLGVRRAGDPQPAPPLAGGARITLITGAGSRFAPKDALRVDADLDGKAFDAVTPAFSPTTLPKAERALEGNPGSLGPAVWWGFLLTIGALLVTVLRLRWGRWQAWLIAVPTLGYLGLKTGGAVACLLPNLF